jgi:hypothetical protein
MGVNEVEEVAKDVFTNVAPYYNNLTGWRMQNSVLNGLVFSQMDKLSCMQFSFL